jgi:hypothetical protein
MDVSIGFDPIAFLTSLFAVWFAYNESSRNNRTLVKIIRCRHFGSSSLYEHNGQLCEIFELIIRNQGITLHDPQVILDFTDRRGGGTLSLPLKRKAEASGHTEFSRGMIAVYRLNSCELDRTAVAFLHSLENPTTQKPVLLLYSQGYLAWSRRVGDLKDRISLRWNRIAYKFNRMFDRELTIGEHTVVSQAG